MKPVTRQKVNFIIDILLLIATVFIIVIGFVIRYVLIPGSERWEKFGRNVELSILGLDRHQWGFIHLIVGLLFVGLLVLHLIFHWKQIVAMTRKILPGMYIRYTFVGAIVGIIVIVAVLPFLIPLQLGDLVTHQGRGVTRNSIYQERSFPEHEPEYLTIVASENSLENINEPKLEYAEPFHEKVEHSSDEHILDIRGFNTIEDLAKKYDVSADSLKNYLKIPPSVSNNERLGRIRRTYDFTMGDVEEAILKLQKK